MGMSTLPSPLRVAITASSRSRSLVGLHGRARKEEQGGGTATRWETAVESGSGSRLLLLAMARGTACIRAQARLAQHCPDQPCGTGSMGYTPPLWRHLQRVAGICDEQGGALKGRLQHSAVQVPLLPAPQQARQQSNSSRSVSDEQHPAAKLPSYQYQDAARHCNELTC